MTQVTQKQLEAALLILECLDPDCLDFDQASDLFSAKESLKAILNNQPKPVYFDEEKRKEVIHKYDLMMVDLVLGEAQ